jgi:predicted transcriptional regulator
MSGLTPLQGDLQLQVMRALWHLGEGSVEAVREALPHGYQGAYTTVQTVLNRLADRTLLSRARRGKMIVYRPVISEAEYLSQSIHRTLASASSDARHAALAELIGGLEREELSEIQRLAQLIERERRGT